MGDTQTEDAENLGDIYDGQHVWSERLNTQGPYPGEDVHLEDLQWGGLIQSTIEQLPTSYGPVSVHPSYEDPYHGGSDIVDLTYGVPQEHPAADGGGAFDYYPPDPQFPDLHMPSDDTVDPPVDEQPGFDVQDF